MAIETLHTTVSQYHGSELQQLEQHFAILEQNAEPIVDASLKGKARGIACRSFNKANYDVWSQARRLGATLYGRVRCTFARIATPGFDGRVANIFSMQRGVFERDLIIEDCGLAELDPVATKKLFGAPAPCDRRDYFNAGKPHLGKLDQAAWEYINECTNGALTTPYVLYYPRRMTWQFSPKPCRGISGSTKGSDLLLPILAGAASYFIG